MTAVADRRRPRSVRRAGHERRRRAARSAAAVALLVATAATLAGCTGADSTAGTVPAPPRPAAAASTAGAGADERAIRDVVDELNATAGGPVDRQQTVLRGAVDPALLDQLDRCPAATSTLRFEPVYAALRPDPDWQGASGTPAGTVYALPVLIRIFTGDRITGTDLGTIFLGVRDGRALLAPVCVN